MSTLRHIFSIIAVIVLGLWAGKAVADSCLGCHDINITGLSIHQPVGEGRCIICHGGSEAGDTPHKDLVPDSELVIDRCMNCHQTYGDNASHKINISYATRSTKTMPPDLPFLDGLISCNTCHYPHSSDEPALLRKAYDSLCSTCHPYALYGY